MRQLCLQMHRNVISRIESMKIELSKKTIRV